MTVVSQMRVRLSMLLRCDVNRSRYVELGRIAFFVSDSLNAAITAGLSLEACAWSAQNSKKYANGREVAQVMDKEREREKEKGQSEREEERHGEERVEGAKTPHVSIRSAQVCRRWNRVNTPYMQHGDDLLEKSGKVEAG